MTIRLSPADSARWTEGAWSGFRVEESVIEDLERQNIREPVVVELDTGEIIFAISKGVLP